MPSEQRANLESALSSLDGVIAVLRHPVDGGESCCELLQNAVQALGAVSKPGAASERELVSLRTRLDLAGSLLGAATAFYTGWARLAQVTPDGYTRDGGQLPEPVVPGSLVVDG